MSEHTPITWTIIASHLPVNPFLRSYICLSRREGCGFQAGAPEMWHHNIKEFDLEKYR